jgi:hypothetical protein
VQASVKKLVKTTKSFVEMPHTSRKGVQYISKYQQTTDQDGWTHVFRGSKKSTIPKSYGKLVPTKIPKDLTVAALKERHETYVKRWNDSKSCKDLEQIIEQRVLQADHVVVENCVCLGLGSFTGGDNSRRECAWFQLVALQSILSVLNKKHIIAKVLFQDPQFNLLDEQFLQSLGYSTVLDPEAYDKVDSTSLLYIPHGELEVTSRALSGTNPALFIGNDLAVWVDR